MAYHGLIERWRSETLIYVYELPGFVAIAADTETALEHLPNAVNVHLRWLDAHGLPYQPGTVTTFEEGVATDTGIGPFFQLDAGSPSLTLLENAEAIGRAALDDLIVLYEEASAEQRAYKFKPDEWSAAEIVRHIAEMDVWYSTRLSLRVTQDFNAVELPADPIAALHFASTLVEERLQQIYDPHRSLKYDADEEDWSLAKVMRRRTAHLREHYPQLLRAVRQRMVAQAEQVNGRSR